MTDRDPGVLDSIPEVPEDSTTQLSDRAPGERSNISEYDPTKPFDLRVEWIKYTQPATQFVQKYYPAGDRDIRKGIAGAKYLYGETDLQTARNEYVQFMAEDQQAQKEYASLSYADSRKYLIPIVESLPFMKEVYEDTAQGMVVGGGVGALAGSPGGLVGAGTGGAAGAVLGGEAAGAVGAGRIAAGNIFLDLIDAGVPEDKAKPIALVTGGLVGALQTVQLGFLGNIVRKGATKTVSTANATFGNYMANYLKGVATFTTVSDAQAAVNIIARHIAQISSGVKVAPTIPEILDTLIQSTVIGATQGAATIPVAHGVGKGIQKINEHLLGSKPSKTPMADAAEILGTVIQETRKPDKQPTLLGQVEKSVVKKQQTKTESELEIEASYKAIAQIQDQLKQAEVRVVAAEQLGESGVPERKQVKQLKRELELEKKANKQLREADVLNARAEVDVTAKDINKHARNRPKASEYGPEHYELLALYDRLIQNQIDQRKKKDKPPNEALNILQDEKTIGTVERRIASDVIEYLSDDVKAIRKINETLKELMEGGINERLERDIARAKEVQQTKDDLKPAITGGKELSQNEIDKLVNAKKPFWSLDTLMQTMKPWNALMDQITIRSKAKEAPESVQINKVLDAEVAAIDSRSRRAVTKIAGGDDAASIRQLSDHMQNSSERKTVTNESGEPLKYTDRKGDEREMVASRGELMQWYIDMKRHDMESGLTQGNKFTFRDNAKNNPNRPLQFGETSFEEFLDTTLTDYEKGVADRIREHYNEDSPEAMFNTLNDAVVDEYAIPLKRSVDKNGQGDYTGNRKHEHSKVVDGTLDDLKNQFRARQKLLPGAAHKKVDSALSYKQENIYRRLFTDITTNTSWEITKDTSRRLYKVFGDKEIRELVTAYGNGDTIQIIDTALDDSIGTRPAQYANRIHIVDTVNRNVAAVLGGKPESGLKQASSFMLFLSDPNITAQQFASGLLTGAKNPKAVLKALKESQFIRFREELLSREVADWYSARGPKWMRTNPALIKASMWFIVNGDRITARIGGYPVYLAALERYTKAGKTNPHELALQYFDKIASETQGSGRRDQRVHIERSGHSFAQAFVQLGKQPMQIAARELNAINKFWHVKNFDTLGYAVRVVVAAHVAEGLFQALGRIPQFTSEDKKERDKAALMTAVGTVLGPFGSVPMWGEILTGIAVANGSVIAKKHDPKFKTPSTFEPNTTYGKMGVNAVRLSKASAKAAAAGEMSHEQFWSIMKNAAQLGRAFTPLPLPVIERHLEGLAPKPPKKSDSSDRLQLENQSNEKSGAQETFEELER